MDDYQKMQNAVQAIFDRDGGVKPSIVVAESESPESPLHKFFEWNQKKAAHKYRISQAQELLKNVKVLIKGKLEPLVYVPSEQEAAEQEAAKRETQVSTKKPH